MKVFSLDCNYGYNRQNWFSCYSDQEFTIYNCVALVLDHFKISILYLQLSFLTFGATCILKIRLWALILPKCGPIILRV